MRIEFDPTNPTEAAAVRTMLTAVQPQEERRFAAWINEKLDQLDDAGVSTHGPSDDPEELERVEEEVKELLAAPETDSTGTPWDERIHSTPATTNKDGTWRAKRGVTADQIAAVRAEREVLEAVGADVTAETVEAMQAVSAAFEGPVTAPPAPPAPTGQSEAPFVPDASVETNTTQTNSPSNGTEVNATGSATSAAPPSFLDVMKAITAAQKDGKIDTAKVKELCAAVGAGESTMGLNGPDNGDKRGAFMALLASETEGA